MKTQLTITQDNLSLSIQTLQTQLQQLKINQKTLIRNVLAIEEVISTMLHKSEDGSVELTLQTLLGQSSITITSKGEACSLDELHIYDLDLEDETEKSVIHDLMERILGDNVTLTRTGNLNICKIKGIQSTYYALIKTFMALLLGAVAGIFMKLAVPENITSIISDNIFSSITTMFLNAIKMIVAPLVFFSMANSISGFSNLKSLGKIAMKVVIGYLCTSAVAIGIGYLIYRIFPIGNPALASAVSNIADATIATTESVSISIKDTIVNIIPSSFMEPFVENDMLQLVFLGILLGIGVSAISKVSPKAKDTLKVLDTLFSKITSFIIEFMPVSIFCSIAKMVINMDLQTLSKVFVWIPVAYFGYILMILFYCLLVLGIGRLNPLKFLKGAFPSMITAYSLSSSNAAMPTTLECCEHLGISKKIYSFSIPLGTTINMDGTCIMLMMTCLFMAKIFGVSITANALLTLVIAIMAISVGCPGVPGASLVCMAILFPQIGVPAEAISLIMGIQMIVSMGLTLVNVTGDSAISLIVARSENLLDIKKYNAN